MKRQAIRSDQDQGMQLQQLQTDTQPETPSKEAQGNLENNVHRSQDSESLEQLVDLDIEISEEPLESTAVPANNLLLSQNRGDLHQPTESTPGPSPPVKVSSKIAIAFYKLCYLNYRLWLHIRKVLVNTTFIRQRESLIKHSVCKNYISMAAGAVDSSDKGPAIVSRISTNIKREMKTISAITHNSFLRNSVESIKQFSWEAVHEELLNHIPMLMASLSGLIPKSAEQKPLQCIYNSITAIKMPTSRNGLGAASSISYDVWK